LIDFLFRNISRLDKYHANFILPIVYDWNNKFKEGITTKQSSLIALKFYQSEGYSRISKPDEAHHLLTTIANGAKETREEISKILDEIITQQHTNYNSSFIGLSYLILTEFAGLNIAKVLPEKTISLAKVFWLKDYTDENDPMFQARDAEEKPFGITDDYHLKYYPESPYQTPILALLVSNQKATIDFIIDFINSVATSLVRYYGNNNISRLIVNNSYFNSTIYSNRDLWCMYRGVPMHVPNLVSSILMALEKFFIDRGKATSNEIFEYWLLYLLKKSNSTIIYGLVNSIVLAFPEKTYSIAKILFSFKDFFLFDNTRKGLDQSLKGQITTANQIIGKPIGTDLHEKARLDACDEKHRKQSLEDLFFSYQIKKIGNITEQQYCLQREELWTILDNYYSQLPNQQESEEKNLWRLCLARIDTRKMEISTHCIDNGTLINFIPKLDNDIIQYSQSSLNKIANDFRYMSLKQWAEAKLNQIEISKDHEKYDSTPKLALEEAKEIIKILSQQSDNNLKSDNTFLILNQYTPIYVFTTLIKHYKDILPSEDLSFCISETIGYLLNALQPSYHFQHGSGIDYCFYVLPDIILTDPTKLDVIKWIILLSLFNTQSITITGGHHFYNFATNFVLQLWKSHREHAESVLFAYIRLIKKYTELVRETHQKAFNNGIYHPDFNGLPSRFYNENEVDIRDYFNNNLPHPSLEDVNYLELPAKNIALFLIPCESNSNYKDLFKTIIKPTLSILFNKNSKVNHTVKDELFNNYAKFILSVSINEIDEILQPFIENLTPSEIVADFLDSIILVQDRLAAHDNFWYVWKKLLPLLTDLINYKYHYHHSEKIIKSYLFVQRWKDSTKSWHTFRPNDKRFFKIAAEKLGENPATLLAFSKLLNDIGSEYRNDGIYWLASIIEKNPSLHDTKIDNNTIFYLEKYIKIFIYENKEIIKKTIDLKKCTFVILDFLVNKGEVSAYLLRESII
ncbi:hypothetical protein AI2716V1_2373, partial [Enterobacter cloacae]